MSVCDKLKERVQACGKIQAAMNLHAWDQETGMPVAGGESRGAVMAELAGIYFERITSQDLDSMIAEALGEAQENQQSEQLAFIKGFQKERNKIVRLPKAFYTEMQQTLSQAQHSWAQVMEHKNPQEYLPLLHKVLDLKKKEISYLRENESPYEVLLDQFEPQTKLQTLDPIFKELESFLTPFAAEKSAECQRLGIQAIQGEFYVAAQKEMVQKALKVMGFDEKCGRLDRSVHPFTQSLHPQDVRLTVRYEEDSFVESLYGALHEGGHGLYEQGLPQDWAWTPMGEAVSLGIHESQSRLWENNIGRSEDFWEGWFPQMATLFPKALFQHDAQSLRRQLLRVAPGPIRVAADEVHYNLHILIRYNIEKALFEDSLPYAEIESFWNDQTQKLLGFAPKNPLEGFLQDVHWSAGLLGYFPTYTLGNLLAAQLHHHMELEIPDFKTQVRTLDFKQIRKWLNQKIHQHGSRYLPQELIEKACGEPLKSTYFLNYLKNSYRLA